MRFLIIPFLFIGLLLLQSCQKEVDFSLTSSQVTGEFTAKIDGTPWVANKAAAATRMNGLISISGMGNDKRLISITLTDSGVHRYILSDMTMNAAAYVDSNLTNKIAFASNQGTYPTQAGGEVNITSIDTTNKKISGTFSFKVYRIMDGMQRTITEGKFTNISYATTLPPSSSTDTFRVKIAGTTWIPPAIFGGKTPAVPPMTAKIGITGTDVTSLKSVGLQLPADVTPGTYTLDFFGGEYIGLYNPDSDPMHSQASFSGTVTILEHNTTTKRIRGTFNFHAEALLDPLLNTELTEGYFSVKYF